MAKSKSTPGMHRGDQFERDYLLRMGLLKPATQAPSELEQLREVASCCEYLLPIAQAAACPGNAPELVAKWLKAVAAVAQRAIANGGMGAVAPMVTQKVDGQLINTRK